MRGIDTRQMLCEHAKNLGVKIVLEEGIGVAAKPPHILCIRATAISTNIADFLRAVLNLHMQGKIEIDPDLLEDLQRGNFRDITPDQENQPPPSAAVEISPKKNTDRPKQDDGPGIAV